MTTLSNHVIVSKFILVILLVYVTLFFRFGVLIMDTDILEDKCEGFMIKLWALSILRYCLYSAFRLSLDCKYFGQLLFGETGTIKDKLMVK